MEDTAEVPPRKQPPRSALKRDLYRLVVARSDLLASMDACDLMLEPEMDLADRKYMPLLHAVAVAYARPFTANKPYGALPGKWAKFDDAGDQHVHDTMLELRHQWIAHSDADAREVVIWPPGTRPPMFEFTLTSPWVSVKNRAYPIGFVRAVRAHCHALGERVNSAVDTLMEELYEKRVLPIKEFPLTVDEDL